MISKVLRVLAFLCFVLACFNVSFKVALIPLGLALWVGSGLVD